ncbi:membrane protein [Pseudomonas veronii 1YdBTEX2]|uniref:Membrane protein n=1 Tax=Pseudomonas veronii 1YdBTEX2 TaxID=1295141 RepID=A0A1D3K7W9_PSEVE|nr:membrane protein [Pseudomonas veronii 1YdBTEX2]
MESNPTVFAAASDITVDANERWGIKLSAPGFVVEISSDHGSLSYSLRSQDEVNTRPGFEHPLSFVVADHSSSRTVAHFTSRKEADKLIEMISAARDLAAKREAEEREKPNPFLRTLFTFAEMVSAAVLVGFIGSAAANIGWNIVSPVVSRITGVPTPAEQYSMDQSASSNQINEVLDAVPMFMTAFRNARISEEFQNLIDTSEAQTKSELIRMQLLPSSDADREIHDRQQILKHIPPYARTPEQAAELDAAKSATDQ